MLSPARYAGAVVEFVHVEFVHAVMLSFSYIATWDSLATKPGCGW